MKEKEWLVIFPEKLEGWPTRTTPRRAGPPPELPAHILAAIEGREPRLRDKIIEAMVARNEAKGVASLSERKQLSFAVGRLLGAAKRERQGIKRYQILWTSLALDDAFHRHPDLRLAKAVRIALHIWLLRREYYPPGWAPGESNSARSAGWWGAPPAMLSMVKTVHRARFGRVTYRKRNR